MTKKSRPHSNIRINDSDLFFNRELSWLEFNCRVLNEANCADVPLFERLKFLMIFDTNLDEFYMVRMAGLKKMLKEGIGVSESPDQLPIKKTLSLVNNRVRELIAVRADISAGILKELSANNIVIKKMSELLPNQKIKLDDYFHKEVYPVLTPLAVDSSHPFPSISNLSLHLVIRFEGDSRLDEYPIGFVEIPSVLPGLVKIESEEGSHFFVEIQEIIGSNLNHLFHYFQVKDYGTFRITRNLDYTLLENNVVDLLKSIQREMITREQQEAVRLEIEDGVDSYVIDMLKQNLSLVDEDVFKLAAPLEISKIMAIYDLPFDDFRYTDFNPRLPAPLATNENIFSILSSSDLLVHHPYESFYAVTEFLNAAASDKRVLAIKQTLYRTSGDSPIIETLIRAAENGIKVTAVIELKARFDEKNNIVWARRLERAGINVVFGFVGLKTHCKATLVIRRENKKLARYVHLSTGNYNSQTAKIYTDLGLFTSDLQIGKDISTLFNILTGFNILSNTIDREAAISPPQLSTTSISPLSMRDDLISLIDREISAHKKNSNGKIIAKMNALVDKQIIKKLYEASNAGVEIQLIVRGICCLRPGVKGLSENIEVRSIIDRFLEHSRAYFFNQDGKRLLFLGSADWMPRNMDRRIEIMFPILDERIKARILNDILPVYWDDNTKSRVLNTDGTYTIKVPKKGEEVIRAQEQFIRIIREEGVKSIPYDKAIRHDPSRKKGVRPIAKKR